MIDAYIPIANNQVVEKEILDALSDSETIDSVWVHPTKEFYPRGDQRRHHAIARNTLDIFKRVQKCGDEFFLMCNSNNMTAKIPFIGELLEYIQNTPKCGTVAYNPKRIKKYPMHVAIGFCIMRTEAIKNIKFDFSRINLCNCYIFCDEIRKDGWTIENYGSRVYDNSR